jgi:hypothetical protein
VIPLVRAELLKLQRQRGAAFWGFAALPCLLVLLACALDASLMPTVRGAIDVHPIRTLLRALGTAGNPVAQLFFAVGAGALFALDYRHATWRLLVPRRSRTALMTAKLAAFAIAAAGSLILLCAGNLASVFAMPALHGVAAFTADAIGTGGVAVALTFAVSMLELAGLAAQVALMAVLTRSTMGAILPPFLLALGSASIQTYFGGESGPMLMLPGAAADSLRNAFAVPFDGDSVLTGGQVTVAGLIVAGWFAVPFAAALWAFSRQDLAAE